MNGHRSLTHDLLRLPALALLGAVVLLWTPVAGQVQVRPVPVSPWETAVSKPNDPDFYLPAHPVAFVRAPAVESTVSMCQSASGCSTDVANCTGTVISARQGMYHLGADVLTANDPDPGNQLWIYLPSTGAVKKLFPRAVHETTGVIDFLKEDGSVIEPNLSEDGTKLYFAYFQDSTDAHSTTEYLSKLPLSGADLYVIDIAPLLADPSTHPDTLSVQRLTHRSYSAGNPWKQDAADRDKDAMNPTVAAATSFYHTEYGTVFMHPTEVRTRNGLHLAYVSNKRRLDNSNTGMQRSNYNFNLHMAPILPDGTLGPEDNQGQYYTTTSALSPTPLREGLAISYQASTEDARMWHIQGLDSEGRWYPVIGYGSNPELFHLATFCVSDEGGTLRDYLVAIKYYNANNEGFGSLWKQDLSILGKNFTQQVGFWFVPRQAGSTELTDPPGISLSADYPAPTDASGNYYGKYTSPRCGGVDDLYFAYTPTSANGRLFDDQCNKDIYESYIGHSGLQPHTPGTGPGGHQIVVRHASGDFNLLWPVPIVPWSTRSAGDATQQFSAEPIAASTPWVAPGEPYAQIGTSALYNTDRRPFECSITQPASGSPNWYSPWGVFDVNQEHDLIGGNQDTWTRVTQGPQNDFCVAPDMSQILGIAISLTSNKTNLGAPGFGYETVGGPDKEAARLLGVYDVRQQPDQSFLAAIPANAPFELQALDATHGMKLTDVRSWHSLKPREIRTDCGGCHQHDVNAAPIPFAGTWADGNPPIDLVRATPSIGYDDTCNLEVGSSTAPAEDYPEWRADIWPLMDQFCGNCHNSTTGNGTGNAALSWPDASEGSGDQVWQDIASRRFAHPHRGALGSQLFWAARGQRTDGRDNAAYPASYACTGCNSKDRWGFQYSTAHDAMQDKCTTAVSGYGDWLFSLGKWIDNHMPRNTGAPYPFEFDWYHPTADSGLVSVDCTPTRLRVGWWDDSDELSLVEVLLNDDTANPLYQNVWVGPTAPIPNGAVVLGLPAVSPSDWITVEVRDGKDNRQIYRKRVEDLIAECQPGALQVEPLPHP